MNYKIYLFLILMLLINRLSSPNASPSPTMQPVIAPPVISTPSLSLPLLAKHI